MTIFYQKAKWIGEAGPIGRSSKIHAKNMTIQPMKNTIEYGSIKEMTVPIPAFLS